MAALAQAWRGCASAAGAAAARAVGPATAARPPRLLRATLTLMAGGALAQALPLLLGPLLTRLYTPQQFGLYHLFAAVAANVAVVACARYEHRAAAGARRRRGARPGGAVPPASWWP